MYADSVIRDFARIRSVKITRKNKTIEFVAWIMFFSPLFILATFVLMFVLFQVPMNNNGTTIYPGDPSYLSFTVWSIGITGFLALVFLFLAIFGKHLSKPEYIYLYEDYDSNLIMYGELRKKNVLIDKDKMIIAYHGIQDAVVETNLEKILSMRQELCFWYNEEALKNAKLKEKNDGYAIKIVTQEGFRRLVDSVRVTKNEGGVVERVRQTIYYSTYGNQNLKSMKVDFYEDINVARTPSLDTKIQRKLQEYM